MATRNNENFLDREITGFRIVDATKIVRWVVGTGITVILFIVAGVTKVVNQVNYFYQENQLRKSEISVVANTELPEIKRRVQKIEGDIYKVNIGTSSSAVDHTSVAFNK